MILPKHSARVKHPLWPIAYIYHRCFRLKFGKCAMTSRSSSVNGFGKCGWSGVCPRETLAAKADIDRAFLSGIERGVENPTLFTIQAIADALETGVGNLMKGI